MKKIVFLDVDGTLIDYHAQTPVSAKKAVDLARQNGHRVYICTGCSKGEIEQRDLPELDGMIGGNGNYVEDAGNVVLHQPLSPEETRSIVDWCETRNIGFFLECNSGRYINDAFVEQGPVAFAKYSEGKTGNSPDLTAMREKIKTQFGLLHGDELYRTDVNKISFILREYQDHLDSKNDFPNLVANTWGGKGEHALFGDLSPEGISKKYAIEVLLKHLHASKEDTISFGDAKIDLSMFEVCAFNIAMGNGGVEIKEAADYITDDVNADGLYKAFEYLKLI